MSRKILTGVVFVAVAMLAVAYLGSPVLAVKSLVKAAEAGDEAELERKIDFPALRQSLKVEMAEVMNEEIGARSGRLGRGLGALGLALGPSLIDGAVDAMVTPGVVARVVRTGRRPEPGDAQRTRDETRQPSDPELHRTMGYRDLNTFVVRLSRKNRPEQPLRLVMTRRGLFDWKLSGVEFPRPDG